MTAAAIRRIERLQEESKEHKRESARQRKLSRRKAQEAERLMGELRRRGVTLQAKGADQEEVKAGWNASNP